MVVQRHSHLGFFNIQNEGFSSAPALNASLIQSLLFRLYQIGKNSSGQIIPGSTYSRFKNKRRSWKVID